MLLFDFDGTLVDSNGLWVEVDKIFLARRGAPYTREYYEGVAHTSLPQCAVFTREYLHLEESCQEIMDEWMELAADRYAHVTLKPYVREYLTRCQKAGERMVLFTACVPVHCQAALETHGLEHYFEQIIYTQQLGMEKKDPETFRRVAALLGTPPEECVLYDDSLAACTAAREAGMTVAGVYDHYLRDTMEALQKVCHRYIMDFGELL